MGELMYDNDKEKDQSEANVVEQQRIAFRNAVTRVWYLLKSYAKSTAEASPNPYLAVDPSIADGTAASLIDAYYEAYVRRGENTNTTSAHLEDKLACAALHVKRSAHA